jgi:hypothetical protein
MMAAFHKRIAGISEEQEQGWKIISDTWNKKHEKRAKLTCKWAWEARR